MMFHILLCPVNDIIRIGKLAKQWNQILEHECEEVVKEALEQPEKSPQELAFHITDTREWYGIHYLIAKKAT